MRVGRLVLVVATLVAILLFPLVLRDAVQALRLPSAYAAQNTADAGGRLYQNGNNNDNGNANDNDDDDDGNNDDDDDDNENNNESSDNDDEDNDNFECYVNLNDNEEVPCDFVENDNFYVAPAPASAPVSAPASRRCFGVGETGEMVLMLSGGSIVIRVVPPAGLPQTAWIELDDVDPASVPMPPAGASVLDSMVWRIDSGSACDGGAAGQIAGAVNLGIPYHVSADKSKLQIVRLVGGSWVEVPTVPDPAPNNPYISATIQDTGIYAVIQKP